MAPCCSHTNDRYFDLNLKSLVQKLTAKMRFICKMHVMLPSVTFTVTTGQRSWCEMKGYIRVPIYE